MAKLKLVSLKKDTKVWENIKKNILKGKNNTLDVGFFETAPNYENGLTVAQVAQYNNEGVGIPMRSFMTDFRLKAPRMYNAYFQEAMQRIASGKSSFTKEYSMIGPLMKADMQEIIEEWDTPPNSQKTIALKGGRDDPLVDTGHMHDNVDWRVGTK